MEEVVCQKGSGGKCFPDDGHGGCAAVVEVSRLEAFQHGRLTTFILAVRMTHIDAHVGCTNNPPHTHSLYDVT